MEVVAGPEGPRRVHYEAPAAARLEAEMQPFLDWFNRGGEPEGLLRAALAHLWLVTIHPFEDGNGRIARAIADKALAQSEHSPQRFYSMASQIRKERAAYYAMLERTQKGELDITEWMLWFLGCFARAIDGAETDCETYRIDGFSTANRKSTPDHVRGRLSPENAFTCCARPTSGSALLASRCG